jgi:hypothetical protein
MASPPHIHSCTYSPSKHIVSISASSPTRALAVATRAGSLADGWLTPPQIPPCSLMRWGSSAVSSRAGLIVVRMRLPAPACAARLRDHVAAVLVIAGVAPYGAEGLDWFGRMGEDNIIEFRTVLAGGATLRPLLETAAAELRQVTAEGLITQMNTLLPPIDRAQLTGQLGEDFAATFRESVRTGMDGSVDDDLAFATPWGFALDEITIPALLWQGSADLMLPCAHGQWLARHIPTVVAHLEDGEGHLSIGVGGMGRMLEALLAAAN